MRFNTSKENTCKNFRNVDTYLMENSNLNAANFNAGNLHQESLAGPRCQMPLFVHFATISITLVTKRRRISTMILRVAATTDQIVKCQTRPIFII